MAHPLKGMTVAAFAVAAFVIAGAETTLAQSSLGIGSSEVVVQPVGPFAGILNWIATQQREFYRAMTAALTEMKQDGSAIWLLAGLSFLYGILHAAGPGHGKAVISSYMLANEVELRRGIMLSFISAMLQAVTAIVIVSAAYLVLRGTSVKMSDATRFLEISSYVLVLCFGLWLLWTKLRPRHAPVLAFAGHGHHHDHDHDHGHHHHDHGHDHHHHHHDHGDGEVCATCGHAHAPDPALLRGEFGWRSALAAIAAVGLRPCTGALIVLSFAMLNGLVLGGVVSAFTMALGTGITVAALATLAVTAKNTALYFAGDGILGARLHRAIEIAGAAFIVLVGALLLSAAMSV